MQPVPVGYPIEKLSGPLIVAYLLHWGLFGTLSVQLSFPMDRKFTKCLVYGIYIVEFVQTMVFTDAAFTTFGYGFGDLEALTGMYFNWFAVPIMSSVCIITSVWCFSADNAIELNSPRMSVTVGILCGASALCDIIIAICMTHYLMRSSTGFRRTQMLVTKLIRLIVETGSVTAVVALLSFILFFAFPHQTFYGTPTLIVAKLYANNVYMVLNSRIRIIGGRDTYTSSTDMSITTTMIKDMTSQSTEGAQPTDRFQGRVSVVTITPEVFNDDYEMGQEKEKSQGSSISLYV
ncbi:hypothetical protein ARMGADRAFT_1066479 [Armillaria gallica]|uniref:DUF6534 domain-containing protein n=1 Tax=Armillaria gallica TaxID=47427 RepID=A0A2H3DE78_ARMGA|nr:hypothetical protein ARMGADRAFT_1066479 [Armillaria gallica]